MKKFKDQIVGTLFHNDQLCDQFVNLVKLVFYKPTNVHFIYHDGVKKYILLTPETFCYIDNIEQQIIRLQEMHKKQEEEFNTLNTDENLTEFFTLEDNDEKDIRIAERNAKKNSQCYWNRERMKSIHQTKH